MQEVSHKIVVTGANGQLGRAVVAAAAGRGWVAIGQSHQDLPVEDDSRVAEALGRLAPDFVIHCAAWTDVDGCEQQPARADAVNARGTESIARACRAIGSGLIYVSTDFVFDGKAKEPYRTDALTAPLSVYGRSKLGGEQAVLAHGDALPFYVVRTSWVFGPSGRNFPKAILGRARSGQPLRVVDDQFGSPTYTEDLAEALLDLIQSRAAAGIYHASNQGVCSWFEFARELVAAAGLTVEVAPMSSAELDRPAPRPAYSVLCCERLATALGRHLPHYRDAIGRYLSAENAAEAAASTMRGDSK